MLVVERPDEPLRTGFVPLGEPLLARVRVRPGFEGVARALLGDVNLVDDLAEVAKVYASARAPATFVTPAGDVLGPDGVLRGGSGGGTGLLARAREVRELEQEVATLGQHARSRGGRARRERRAPPRARPTSSTTCATATTRRRSPSRTTRRTSSACASA